MKNKRRISPIIELEVFVYVVAPQKGNLLAFFPHMRNGDYYDF